MSKKSAVPNVKGSESLTNKYLHLLDKGAAIGENSNITNTLRKIQSLVCENEDLATTSASSKNLSDRAGVLDAKVLTMCHKLVNDTMVQAGDSDFNEDEYADKLLNIMGPEMDWDKLSPYFLKGSRTFNGTLSMLGTFKINPAAADTTQPKTQTQRRENNVETTEQQHPHCGQTQSKADMPLVNAVMNCLVQIFKKNGNVPISYYKMICDPGSFSNTINNMFQLSFLFREERICFGIGKDDLPTVCLVTKELKKSGNFVGNHQFVNSIDPFLWQDIPE